MVDYKIVGAVATGVIDGIMEGFYNYTFPTYQNVFPFVKTIDPLPPADDWLILAVPALAYLYGRARGNAKAMDFGFGGLLYAGSMFIHHTIVRAARMAAGKPP